jgi:hypothetical protein
VDAEAVNTLKLKIDALEKNIVAQLEKKMGEQHKSPAAGAPPPPPPPQAAQINDMLYCRIEELERRLADFGHAAALSTSQLKSIEESKISARREIEDLLKAVREQHKYSEMDQQMHQQLEKSWARAEELEKKLMDFYSTVLQMESLKREEATDVADKTVAALEKLSARIDGLEKKIEGVSAAVPDSQELAASLRESSASFKEIFDNYVRRELELLRDKLSSETEAMRRASSASSEEIEKRLNQQAAAAAEHDAEFSRVAEANRLKAEGVQASLEAAAQRQAEALEAAAFKQAQALEAATRRQTLALEEFSRRLESDIRGINTDFASSVKKESDARFEKFGAKYADALLSVNFIEGFRAALTESIDKLDAYDRLVAGLLKEVSPAQLQVMQGVSGMLVRKHFEELAGVAAKVKSDMDRLRVIKREVEERFKDIFKAG